MTKTSERSTTGVHTTSGLLPWQVRLCRILLGGLQWIWGTLVAGIIIGTIANLNTTITDTSLSKLYIAQIVLTYPLPTAVVLGALILLTLLMWMGSRINKFPTSRTPSERNRTHMLHRLRTYYEQMLDQSLQGVVRIELGLVSKPVNVPKTLSLNLQLPDQLQQNLSSCTSIIKAYELGQQELLILGEPGAGKSTLLLELAQYLIEQAELDAKQPLPVLLPLSSWAMKQLVLQDWLVEQVASLYNIPLYLSRYWVHTEQILPLLDGLDEMNEAARSACIVAINTYHREHLMSLIVCSRNNEYNAAITREPLRLHAEVFVQPLSFTQVDTYLATLGKSLGGLRAALKKQSGLREIATTPLMLQVLVLTYRNNSVRALPQKKTDLQKQIWAAYVQRMIQRKGDTNHYLLQQTLIWLGWLAEQMREHNQTIFYLEQLQPDWLPEGSRKLYRWSVAMFFVIAIVLFGELVWILTYWLPLWIFVGIVANPIGGLLGSLPLTLFEGLLCGAFFGLQIIRPFEALTWSWADIRSRFFVGLSLGASGGALFLLSRQLMTSISGKQLVERLSLSPNEGIRRSAKNGIFVGLFLTPFVGLFTGLIAMLHAGFSLGLRTGLILGLLQVLYSGLFYGLLSGLFLGLGAFIQHYILRFWLWKVHLFPWSIVHFLDDATARILLRRVGGGYSFTHRLLLDFFADSYADASSPSSAPQSILPSP